jgi:hypothetical protein
METTVYRIDAVLFVAAILPFLMAVLFRTAVIPRRKSNMLASLDSSQGPSAGNPEERAGASEESELALVTDEYIKLAIGRVARDFDSLYGTRLIFPALVLSFFYLLGLSLGISPKLGSAQCASWLCRPFICLQSSYLANPFFALMGAYVFNTGVIIRRSFMADVTKNVFWAAVNRVVFSVGIAIAIYAMSGKHPVVCFSIAFFPRLFVTWMRKTATKLLGMAETAVEELDIQLIQGIDIWKEERLEEEGIESVQNLATADVFGLAVKTHYPLRTIVDWIDQAILIQRFPERFRALQAAGFPVSAIEFAWMAPQAPGEPLAVLVAQKMGLETLVVEEAMKSLSEDTAVRVIWRLWQSRGVDE